jgi:molybdopterin molybdotransferase
MVEFLNLAPPNDALRILLEALPDRGSSIEKIMTTESLGRVTAENVRAPHPLPEFSRSAMDGYAVRARDTFGVTESQPGYLTLVGEVPMGDAASFKVTNGKCALIHTGGMLPEGADAVIMHEYTQIIQKYNESQAKIQHLVYAKRESENSEIELVRAVAVGENILYGGEDVVEKQIVLGAGVRMRPAEIGGCMALGIMELRVATKPIIGIISSGDEVIYPGLKPRPGQIRDVNSYSLAALVTKGGGEPALYGIVPDNLEMMKSIATKAYEECEAVVITAGSSVSARDTTAEAIGSLGTPGVLVHGVNVRPGKPTILGVCGGKAVIGLPGNPVSALVIAGLFVVPVIEKLLGLKLSPLRPSVFARLLVNIASQAGREDWIAVKIEKNQKWEKGNEDSHYIAEPIFGKSNLIFSFTKADGLIRIPPDATGISSGEMVEVMLI